MISSRTLAWFYLPAVALMLTFVIIGQVVDIPFSTFTLDPASIKASGFYVGMISNLGNLLWAVTSVVCLLSAAILTIEKRHARTRLFLLASGLFTAILLCDDLFMLHNAWQPDRERTLFFTYIGVTVLLLVIFQQSIRNSEYILLLTACAFFGSAVMVDILHLHLGHWFYVFEDGPKFLGIVGWFGYFSRTSLTAVLARKNAF